jgi:beta-mannosidase
MHQQALQDNWTVKAIGDVTDVPADIRNRAIPAVVPGCVHTDLLAAKLIPDPYLGRNEEKLHWIGRTEWRYGCHFNADAALLAHERVALVCEGLDTVARIELNRHLLGEAANMHHPHRFEAKPLLRAGQNELSVTFTSAFQYAAGMEKSLGTLPHAEKHPFNFIRKMACNFGWDWGPDLATAGIWQPIYLLAWNTARIAAVRPLVTEADAETARVEAIVNIERAHPKPVSLRAVLTESTGRTFEGRAVLSENGTEARIVLTVPNPQRWWPRGHGEHPLYDLSVRLFEGHTELDWWSSRVGLRTVRLNTDKDSAGSRFAIEVNGKPVFCKGANWIPDDCFPTRVDATRYRKRIEQAAAANMNMLRVWGGGIFETDTFYSICDELGIMVWQDFLFACAAYAEEEPLASQIEAEARHNIVRLAKHPSLVIWNGCNENIWGYFDWNWKDKIGARTWGLGYYLEMLPRLVRELDPTRPFWPGSPFSGSMDLHPLDDRHGNKHVWDVWFGKDYLAYRNHTPRFCSEFGYQGPATYATLRRAIPPRELTPTSRTMLHHQKQGQSNDRLHERLTVHFDMPDDFNDWLYVTQVNQARALQCGVEWFRSRQPVCMGTLYWQINDCWPVISWACIDGEGRLKPMWYATRRFFAERLLTIQPSGPSHQAGQDLMLCAVNDTDAPWGGRAVISMYRLDGKHGRIAGAHADFAVPPRSVGTMRLSGEPFGNPTHPAEEFLVAAVAGLRAFWYFDVDKNLAYPKPQFDAEVTRTGHTQRVKVTARTFLRDLTLFPDRLDPDAVVNDQLVTLLPGESFTFEFASGKKFRKESLVAPPVLQCVNPFGQGK